MATAQEKFIDTSQPTAYGGKQPVLKSLKSSDSAVTMSDVSEQLATLDSYTRHRFVKRKFPRLPVWAPYQGYRVEIDLLSMERFALDNSGTRYLLNVVDQFSRMAYCEPLKTKTPAHVCKAFSVIRSRIPYSIQSVYADDGNEWKGDMQKYLTANNIKRIIATSWVKASIVERFQKTLKQRIIRYMRQHHSYRYVHVLSNIVNNINKSVNRSIKTAPINVNFHNQRNLYDSFYKNTQEFKRGHARFSVGDDVIIALKNSVYKRGYEQNYSDEVFRVSQVIPTSPVTYMLEDRKYRSLPRKFYERELQKVVLNADYLYDLDVRGHKGTGRNAKTLVHFLTEPEDSEEWVPSSTIVPHRSATQTTRATRRRK